MPAASNERLKLAGVSRVVQLLCDAVKNASAYELQFTQNPNDGPGPMAALLFTPAGSV